MKQFIAGLAFLGMLAGANAQDVVLPENFPSFDIVTTGQPDDGYLFMTVKPSGGRLPVYLVISDDRGTPIYFRELDAPSGGLTIQRNGDISYRSGPQFYLMDSAFQIFDTLTTQGYDMDGHDFIALENGHFLLFGKDIRTVDLTGYGGVADASVTGVVIQELDAEKNVVFGWNSWNHFSITDTYEDLTTSSIDMVHPNTLEIDHDGNILLISRSMNEVTKINRQDSSIIWRLGGKNNMFTFSDTTHIFSRPHDIRLLANGNYTIFDNGNTRDPAYSRALEYTIDQVNMTCDLVWEFDADQAVYAPAGGSTRRLPNGNTIIGFGGRSSIPGAIEVHPDGTRAMELSFTNEQVSYRTMRFPFHTTLFEPNSYSVNFGEWDGYTASTYLVQLQSNSEEDITLTGYSTYTDAFTLLETFPQTLPAGGTLQLTLEYFPGSFTHGYVEDVLTINADLDDSEKVHLVAQQIALRGILEDSDPPTPEVVLVQRESDDFVEEIRVDFGEPIFTIDAGAFDYTSIDALFTLKVDNSEGSPVPFNANLVAGGMTAILTPGQPLTPDEQYYFAASDQYQDYNGNQAESYSEILLDKTSLEPFSEENATVYPNPGVGVYTLKAAEGDRFEVSVLDLSGRLLEQVDREAGNGDRIDLSNFASGTYLLRLEQKSASRSYHQVIIKQ